MDAFLSTGQGARLDPDRQWGCRVDDRLVWCGYRALLLQNDLIQLVVLVDKGAEIVQFLHKPTDLDVLWRAPNGLRPPEATPPGASFFDRWSGGWFEVVPNGGPASSVNGADFGFFAETINVPWAHRILEDTPDCVRVGLWVRTTRTPFLLRKTLTLRRGRAALFIEESLTNEGAEPLPFMWGHHPVVGAPFLDEACRLSAPASTVEVLTAEDGPDHRMGLHQVGQWPWLKDRHGQPLDLRRLPPRSQRSMDNCYLKEFKEGWLAVQNDRAGLGFGLAWDAEVFRYVWIWQALGGGVGYPWYGRTYGIGLEPWSSYPCAGLSAAIENGTARRLAPGETQQAWLTAVLFSPVAEVAAIGRDGTVRADGPTPGATDERSQ